MFVRPSRPLYGHNLCLSEFVRFTPVHFGSLAGQTTADNTPIVFCRPASILASVLRRPRLIMTGSFEFEGMSSGQTLALFRCLCLASTLHAAFSLLRSSHSLHSRITLKIAAFLSFLTPVFRTVPPITLYAPFASRHWSSACVSRALACRHELVLVTHPWLKQ